MLVDITSEFSEILFEHSNDGFVLTDKEGIIIRLNQAFANYFSLDKKTLVGRYVWSVLPENEIEKSKSLYSALFSAQQSGTTFETIIPGSGVSSLMLETTVYFTPGSSNSQTMLSIVRDITEKKQKARREHLQSEVFLLRQQFQQLLTSQKEVEKELLESQAELHKSQQLFISIAKNFPNGAINVIDREYKIVFTDGDEYQKFNLNPKDFVGVSLDVLFPDKDLTETKAKYDKVFKGETQQFEFAANGMYYENIAVPLPNTIGEINQILTVTLNITEKKLAEAKVKENDRRLQAIAENLPGITFQFAMNPDGKFYFTFISEKSYGLFGISPKEIVEHPEYIVQFIHPDDLSSFQISLQESWKSLSPFYWLGRVVVSGKTHWLEAISSPRKIDGDVVIWDGIQFNVTERIESEKRIKRFSDQFKIIIKNAPIVLWSLDKEGRFTLSEGKGLIKLGLQEGQAIGISAFELYGFNKMFVDNLHRAFKGESVSFETYDVVGKSSVAFKHFLQPTYDEKGIIDGLLAISIDATEEHHAKESEARYKALANNLPGVVFRSIAKEDGMGTLTFVSEGIKQFGLKPSDISNIPDVESHFLHPDDLQDFYATERLAMKENRSYRWEGRALINGKTYWIEIVASERISEEGINVWEGIIFDISSRKELEKELASNRARIESAINSTEDYIGMINREYKITMINKTVKREAQIYFGIDLQFGDSIFKVVNKEKWKPIYDKVFNGESVKLNMGADDEYFEHVINPIFDEKGDVVELAIFSKNLTNYKNLERKLIELNESLEQQIAERTKELLQSEQFYRAIAESYPNGMVGIYDDQFKLLFTDGMEYHRLGIDTGHLIDKSLYDIYPEETSKVIADYFRRAIHGNTENFELELGGNFYFYLVTPIKVDNAQSNKILVITLNITERKESERILAENEERFRLVLEQTGQLVYDLDVNTGINRWSGAIELLTQYKPNEFKPDVKEWENMIHPDDRQKAIRELNQTIDTGEPFRVQYRFRRKDGTYFWVDDSGVYLKNSSGKVYRMLGTMKDISVQKEMEFEKERITEKAIAAQRMESIGTLASGIAHEFNNILAIVSLSNEQLKRHSKNKIIQKNATTIQKTVSRGAHIARQLLDFSRSEETDKQPTDLSKLLDEIVSTLRRLLKKTIHVDAEQLIDKAFINGNEKQIYQVLLNLGINAGDAMENGGKLTFSLSSTSKNKTRWIVIKVSDTGSGIPPEIQKRMFEPFFTTKGIGKGTGLGLAIVHGIVSSHEGFIEVESEVGKGTTFTIGFPPLSKEYISIDDQNQIEEVKGNETLLIVDDELFLRTLLAKMLRTQGYTVFEAADGEEALALFDKRKSSIDLVITDMGMPTIDGYQLLKKIRKKKRNMKVLVMTGYMDSDQSKRLEDESVVIIPKPFQINDMTKLIRNILSQKPF